MARQSDATSDSFDVVAWLGDLGLEAYAQAFVAHDIDATVLGSLTDADLKELGVASLGHRKRLLNAIAGRGGAPGGSAPVGGAASGGAARRAAVLADDAERRPVTVLFADLAGYTTLTRELGSEEMHALTARFFAAADEAIVSHGGTIDKRIGDCVMAVFGAPVAHTDDPERAVRAALAVRAAMLDLSLAAGRELAVHIGIAMGSVTASTIGTDHHRQYSITGESVNLAARLTSHAGHGEILIADEVHDVLAEKLDAERIADLAVKGFEGRVPAWRLLGIRAQRRQGAMPFVGRKAELAHLVRILQTCNDQGRGMAVHVRGEPGIGKSRLLAELERLAIEQGFECHAGSIVAFGAEAEHAAITSVARSLAASAPAAAADSGRRSDGHSADREDAERVFLNDVLGLPLPPELRAIASALDHAGRHKGRLAALAALLTRASMARPALVCVEDVHWADEPTLDYLAQLTAAVAECRAVLVMTSRVDGDPLGPAWRARVPNVGFVTIDLPPLRQEDAAELAAALLDADSAVARRCIARADGNPLFLEQLLRHATERGDGDIPPTVQSVVLARADKLPPADRRALQAASVLGQRFKLAALRHVLADEGFAPARLIEEALLRPDGDELVFNHALICDGVYASLLRASARVLHRDAAVWYRDRDLALHAEHLERAADPAAAAAFAAAARAELDAYRPQRALALTRRGLGCAADRAVRHALTLLEAEILLDLAEVQGSLAASARAVGLSATDHERCAAYLALASGLRMVDRLDEAFAALDAAEHAAAAADLVAERARIHHLRGNLYFPQGRITECRAEHELALAWAEKAGTHELRARALSGLGDVEYVSGRYLSARTRFAACLALCREHGLGKIEVANRGMLAITRWFSGESALDEADAGIEAARRVGHVRGELIAQHGRLMALLGLLRLDEARASVVRARALAQQLGAMRFEAENLWFLAMVERLAGDRASAAAILREALALSRETSVGFFGAAILGSLALVTDDARERAAALEEGEALLDAGSVSHNHYFFARDAIDAALAERDVERASRLAARLAAYTAAEPLPWSTLVLRRAEALVAHLRGARGAAHEATLAELAAMARRMGQLDLAAALEAALGDEARAPHLVAGAMRS
ncbi:MAG TPA: adenylate/guanylate cyclase domain-containing protein [Gammaproteobacteria bacterium]